MSIISTDSREDAVRDADEVGLPDWIIQNIAQSDNWKEAAQLAIDWLAEGCGVVG